MGAHHALRMGLHLGGSVLVPARPEAQAHRLVPRHGGGDLGVRLLAGAQRADLAVARAPEHLGVAGLDPDRRRARLPGRLRAGLPALHPRVPVAGGAAPLLSPRPHLLPSGP